MKKNLWLIIFGIQAVVSLALLFFILKLGMLPTKYLAIIIIVLALLLVLSFFLMKPKKGGKESARTIVGKIVSVLLSIVMVVGSLFVVKGDITLSGFTGANTETNSISAIVLKKSSATKLNDLKGKKFGINSSVDESTLNLAIEDAENTIGELDTSDYKDFESLATALYDENVDCIIMDEAYRTIVEAKYDTFTDDTRVIWQYSYDQEVEDFSKETDVTKNVYTIYLSGIDTTGKVSTVSRSDVNMLVTVNPVTKQILLTSIPRDYYVTLANKGKKDKLTHAGIFGVKNSVETVEGFMDIDINYYAKVNFTSLVTIVDALGGIEVYSDQTLNTLHGTTTIKQGYNHMDGETALAFARERYSYASGDNHRVQNQQEVLKGMIKKMTSTSVITNYNSVLSAIDGCFETNMTSDEITSIIKMQINDMATWDIKQCQLTGTGTTMYGGALMPSSKLYYMIPDESSIEKCRGYINQMINGETVIIE